MSELYVTFYNTATAPSEILALSLHDALPISSKLLINDPAVTDAPMSLKDLETIANDTSYSLETRQAAKYLVDNPTEFTKRSEEHTSELQSPYDLVCRLLLEKKKN